MMITIVFTGDTAVAFMGGPKIVAGVVTPDFWRSFRTRG